MNLYFDTEFTGLVPETTLISIGIISEIGDRFYAEFTDFDESLCDDFVKENVLSHLWLLPNDKRTVFNHGVKDKLWYYKGNSEQIRDLLIIWFDHIREHNERLQFISDVCHYDFYLLQNQVFGGAFKMPDYINPVCYDICQDILESRCMGVGCNYALTPSMRNAFDVSREGLIEEFGMGLPKGSKHNALYDAEIIKILYEAFYNKRYGLWKKQTMEEFAEGRHLRRFFDTWYEDPEYLEVTDGRSRSYS